jgi:DNA-directed RNA polymerase specialized sigma24 family protein
MSSLALAHLTREAAAGGEDAWRTLVALLDPMLHSIARGYRLNDADADDVV